LSEDRNIRAPFSHFRTYRILPTSLLMMQRTRLSLVRGPQYPRTIFTRLDEQMYSFLPSSCKYRNIHATFSYSQLLITLRGQHILAKFSHSRTAKETPFFECSNFQLFFEWIRESNFCSIYFYFSAEDAILRRYANGIKIYLLYFPFSDVDR